MYRFIYPVVALFTVLTTCLGFRSPAVAKATPFQRSAQKTVHRPSSPTLEFDSADGGGWVFRF